MRESKKQIVGNDECIVGCAACAPYSVASLEPLEIITTPFLDNEEMVLAARTESNSAVTTRKWEIPKMGREGSLFVSRNMCI